MTQITSEYQSMPQRYLSTSIIGRVVKVGKSFVQTGPVNHVFAIGDVHGCSEELLELLEKIAEFNNGGHACVILLGDYVDRGPNPASAIAIVRLLQDVMGDHVIALLGNHDEAMLLEAARFWGARGAINETTAKSFDYKLPSDVKDWVYNLPVTAEDELHYYVHAGFMPNVPIDDQEHDQMLWIRDKFLLSTFDFGKYVVHGHSISEIGPDVQENRVGIDTGCVFGLKLTAAVIHPYYQKPIAFIQVQKKKK